MELMEGLQIIKEMCKQTPITCAGCPLSTGCPFYTTPHNWSDDDTKHIVAAAEDWKWKHKPKTYMELIYEMFPNANKNEIVRCLCPSHVFGPDAVSAECNHDCEECWNRPATERYQTKEG